MEPLIINVHCQEIANITKCNCLATTRWSHLELWLEIKFVKVFFLSGKVQLKSFSLKNCNAKVYSSLKVCPFACG